MSTLVRGARPPAVVRPDRVLRGDIEGLRAVAVMMVLLFHAGVPGFSGGFAGVDVFFVISGYLITSQLIREATSRGTVSIPQFYARRARRLLPAATLVLVLTAAAGWWLLPQGRRADLGWDVIGSTFYFLNWTLASREVDYLAEDSDPSLLQHYWSLSVEEQFYVVWPLLILVVVWVARRWDLRLRPLLTVTLGVLVAASFAWSVVATAQAPDRAYFVTTTRVWELGVGALLVLVTPLVARAGRVLVVLLGTTGLLLVLVTIVAISTDTPWPGSAALLPTVGTAMVIAAGVAWSENPVARALGVGPLRFLGGISYGLYLWHWPALQLLEVLRPDADLFVRLCVAGASVLAAWATLLLVENPVRSGAALAYRAGRALTYGAVSMLVSGTAGAALVLTAPSLETSLPSVAPSGGATGPGALALVDRASTGTDQPRLIADPGSASTRTGPVVPLPAVAVDDIPRRAYERGCQVDSGVVTLADEEACSFGDPQGSRTVALVGDSKMLQWLPALEGIADAEDWRIQVYTKSACPFVTTGMEADCHEYNEALSAHLTLPGNEPDLLLTSTVAPEEGGMADSMVALVQPIRSAGASVMMIGDNPAPDGASLPRRLSSYECVEEHPDDYLACSYDGDPGSGNELLAAAAAELQAPVLDLAPWICPAPDSGCPPVVGGVLLFRQGTHLTATYVRTLAPLLHLELIRAGAATTPVQQVVWEPAADREPGA